MFWENYMWTSSDVCDRGDVFGNQPTPANASTGVSNFTCKHCSPNDITAAQIRHVHWQASTNSIKHDDPAQTSGGEDRTVMHIYDV